ncbi:type I secretion system permease/ATPase [Veronia pacifica]|uniref:ABC transporter n=1 Tax=Veronia pacifica TaxID=1080227 RepID=A0A1C3E7J2_9GAMM|nr:type I secretion system permease/ATPase [Veronia pacifica]ODA29220.1 ABC transporter [Veronia pacifica]
MANNNIQSQWSIPASAQVIPDPLLDCLVLISESYGDPCSREALIAGLPLNKANLTPDLFPEAAARAGFSARLLRKPLSGISPLLFPCVLLLIDQKACVLRSVDQDKGIATIQIPESGGESEVAISELEETFTGYCLLLKKQYRGDVTGKLHTHKTKGHWLWSMVRNASSLYRDALIASVVVNLFAVVSPLFVMNVYDKIVPNLAFESLWVLAVGAAIAFGFDFILRSLRSSLTDIAGKKIDIVISAKLFAKAMGIPLSKRFPSVGGMAKQLNEFDSVRETLSAATIMTLVDLPFALLFLTVIFFVSGNLVAVPIIASVLILLYTLSIQRKLKRAIEQSNKFGLQKNAHLIESLTALESVKAHVAEGIVQRSWQQMTAHTANWQFEVKSISQSVSYIASFISQLTTVALVVLGVYAVAEGNISMGGIIAAVMLSSRILAPMSQLAGLMVKTNQTKNAIQQLDSLMNIEDEFEDKAHLAQRVRLNGHIDADNIRFTYPNATQSALSPLSLSIEAGEKVAIIGKNGSGKTTLLKLLAGLYLPTEGNLRFDGTECRQIHPADLRHNMGYMAQDIILFNGSIRDNIMFGSRQVTEHQLLRASSLSGVNLFTVGDNEGLDKQVGERGEALSRGQRQTVALARAILNDPPILLMDEPTASMDASTEKRFIKTMRRIGHNRTLVLVSHKMSLMKLVDRIIVLEKGRVLIDGPRDEVLARFTGETKSSGREE